MSKSCSGADEFLSWHKVKPGRALIVGSNTYNDKPPRQDLYADAFGIDMIDGPGVDLVHDLETPLNQTFAHVDCCSVMEHCARPWKMAHNIEECLEPKGTLLFMAPFVWRIHAYPSDYWRFTKESLPILFPRIEWKQMVYLSHEKIYKIPLRTEFGGTKGLARTEVLAFGVRCTDS